MSEVERICREICNRLGLDPDGRIGGPLGPRLLRWHTFTSLVESKLAGRALNDILLEDQMKVARDRAP